MIEITQEAKNYLIDMCKKNNKKAVKLLVKGGGCAGFSYEYEFADPEESPDDDVVINLDADYKFIVDGISLMYVLGTVLDYEETLGGNFLAIKNPNEVSSCGCGKSFSI